MKRWIAATAAVLLAGPAMADQCALLYAPQAAKLEALVKAKFNGATELISYCAPCGDAKASPIPLGTDEATAPDATDFTSLRIGSEEYDAAYVYVPAEKAAPYRNAVSLASLIGCPVDTDTPSAIDVNADWSVTAKPVMSK